MQATLMGFAALATCWAGYARAEATAPQTARRVQLILMGSTGGGPHANDGGGIETTKISSPGAGRFGADVFTYEPRERQVKKATSADPGDGFAVAGIELPGTQEIVAPISAISVPLWMRQGSANSVAALLIESGCAFPGYRPTGFLQFDTETRRANYYGMMSRIACEFGLPVDLFDAMIIRESRYHPTAVSPKKAFGLTQLMPGTALALGVDRYSVEGNLRGGASYLRQQLDRFGQYHLALAAYNAGPGRVRGGLVPRIRETRDYVDNVLSNWSRLSGLERQAVAFPALEAAGSQPRVPPKRQRSAAISIY